jgi:hypothetical protein
MTAVEYNALHAQAKRNYPMISKKALNEMCKAYEEAVYRINEKIILTQKLSPLTTDSLRQMRILLIRAKKTIEDQLKFESFVNNQLTISFDNWSTINDQIIKGSYSIMQKLNMVVPDTLKSAAQITQGINEDYLIGIGDLTNGKITETGIINMFIAVNDKLISNIASRVFQDGYSYSQRIWGVGNLFDDDIKRIVISGLAQGRDAIEIAKDLDIYVNKGYHVLMKRYGALKGGTAAFARRIRKQVYYPSLRIIRSEMYAGLQDNARYMGMINPAASGLYDWIRNSTENFNCVCPDNAAGSPYTVNEIPGYAHPNCLCTIRPRLRDSRQFWSDIKEWANGAQVGYLDNWYNQYYVNVANIAA